MQKMGSKGIRELTPSLSALHRGEKPLFLGGYKMAACRMYSALHKVEDPSLHPIRQEVGS